MENKLMIKLVIGTESIFFISLMITFVYYTITPGFDPQSLKMLDLKSTGIFSVFLFLSSFTLWQAEVNLARNKATRFKAWLAATIALGIIFLFGQVKEYLRLLHQNLSISKDIFGTNFYTLTGFHGLHVFIGLIILSVILILAFLGDFNESGSSVVRTAGLYWHFVDIVWILVFSLVYVLPLYINKGI